MDLPADQDQDMDQSTENIEKELFLAHLGLVKLDKVKQPKQEAAPQPSPADIDTELQQQMLNWLCLHPNHTYLSRLRCNECLRCEGVEYPCVHCGDQFHQECHADQGQPVKHRLCPGCQRNNS